MFTKESLERLIRKVDMKEVLKYHAPELIVKITKNIVLTGSCPFCEKGQLIEIHNKAHCYACGWDGDAVEFLMGYKNMTFLEAIRELSAQFITELVPVPEAPRRNPEYDKLRKDAVKAIIGKVEDRDTFNYIVDAILSYRPETLNFPISETQLKKIEAGLAKHPGVREKMLKMLKAYFDIETLGEASLKILQNVAFKILVFGEE